MKIEEIIRSAGMIADPSYYSNRGATTSDLSCAMLNKIADAIEKNYGLEAMNAFVKMTWRVNPLSATAFLTNLYVLVESGWDFSKVKVTNSDDKIGNEAGAFHKVAFTVCDVGKSDESEKIRKGFRRPVEDL